MIAWASFHDEKLVFGISSFWNIHKRNFTLEIMAHQQFRVLLNYTATPVTPVHDDNTFVLYTCTKWSFIGKRV